MLNEGDHSFVRVIIDKDSRSFFEHSLTSVSKSLARAQVWKSFNDDLIDGVFKTEEYLNKYVIKHLELEPSNEIVNEVLTDNLWRGINQNTPIS